MSPCTTASPVACTYTPKWKNCNELSMTDYLNCDIFMFIPVPVQNILLCKYRKEIGVYKGLTLAAPTLAVYTCSVRFFTCLAVVAMLTISLIRLSRNCHVSWKSGEESWSITSSVVLKMPVSAARLVYQFICQRKTPNRKIAFK